MTLKWKHLCLFFSYHRTSDDTGLCFCVHRWYLRTGLPIGCCLPLLSCGSDVKGPDHTWVVFHTPALQPRSAGQHQRMHGQVLVRLLALSIDSLPVAWRWHKLHGNWFFRAQEVKSVRWFFLLPLELYWPSWCSGMFLSLKPWPHAVLPPNYYQLPTKLKPARNGLWVASQFFFPSILIHVKLVDVLPVCLPVCAIQQKIFS